MHRINTHCTSVTRGVHTTGLETERYILKFRTISVTILKFRTTSVSKFKFVPSLKIWMFPQNLSSLWRKMSAHITCSFKFDRMCQFIFQMQFMLSINLSYSAFHNIASQKET